MLDLDFASATDPGSRPNNEDYLGQYQPPTPDEARTHGWLFALADGVGGHQDGEIASRAAVEHLLELFPESPAGEPLSTLLTRIIRSANSRVYELAGGSGMATTIVACGLRYDRAIVAHAGDSRCYLIREGIAEQLTRDHTLQPNVLSRSLGKDLFLNIDTSEHTLVPGDVLVLCSDGLYHSIPPADLASIAAAGPIDRAAGQLAELAKQRDGDDNISVQLIRVRSVERVGMYRGRPYRLR